MKRDAPHAHRNREPILAVLREVLPPRGLVLEIGSGSGQHAAWYAAAFPEIEWQPTEREDLSSIAAWRAEEGTPNLRAPLRLDVVEPWPVDRADAIVSINVVHASPPEVISAILAGAARVLPPGGPLVLYGAWRDGGVTEPSNEAFERWLHEQDPRWGLKDLVAVRAEAASLGLVHDRTVQMPANNRILVLRQG